MAVSISIGAAIVTPETVDYQTLYECADEALYEAKRSGKDRYVIHVCENTAGTEKEEIRGGI